jgi:hypothetical protein
MTDREQLKLAIDTIDDTYLEVLYRIILAFKSFPLSTLVHHPSESNPVNEIAIVEQNLTSPSEPNQTTPSLFSRLRQIKISAPADFSKNVDAYLNGEKMSVIVNRAPLDLEIDAIYR